MPGYMKQLVLSNAVRNGNNSDYYNKIWSRFNETRSHHASLLIPLAASLDSDLQMKTIRSISLDLPVMTVSKVMEAMLESSLDAALLGWKFMQAHWKLILEMGVLVEIAEKVVSRLDSRSINQVKLILSKQGPWDKAIPGEPAIFAGLRSGVERGENRLLFRAELGDRLINSLHKE